MPVSWLRSRTKPPDEHHPAVIELNAGSMAEAEDGMLVVAARRDRHAFQHLYQRYSNRVYRYCYLRLGSREAAEDATSEVFLRAMTHLEGFGSGTFAGWLFRIAQNVVTDMLKRRQAVPLETLAELVDRSTLPEDLAIATLEIGLLRAALATLPTDQRLVLELQLADLSTEEIAATLKRSPNAVRLLRFRAQKQLRTRLIEAGMGAQRGVAPC